MFVCMIVIIYNLSCNCAFLEFTFYSVLSEIIIITSFCYYSCFILHSVYCIPMQNVFTADVACTLCHNIIVRFCLFWFTLIAVQYILLTNF